MHRDPRQQQCRGMRMPQPVRRPRCGNLAGQLPAQPGHQVIHALRPPRRETAPAGQVHKHRRLIQIRKPGIRARLAQLPQVLAIQPVQLIGDEHAPIMPALHPRPGRVVIARDHLHERGVTAAGMPVPVLQPQRLAQPQARLRQKRPQQPVPHPALPAPGRRIEPRARVADLLDLAGRQHRRRGPAGPAHRDHRAAAPAAAGHMLQHRLVTRPAMGDPVQVPAQRHPVQLVEPIQRHHRVQPGGDRRLGEPGRPRLDRAHPRAVTAAQPGQKPAHLRDPQLVPGQPKQLKIRPPQRQRPRIRLHRVRRARLHPQELQELLGRADNREIRAQHRPGHHPVGQREALNPARIRPVTFRHVP